MASELEFVPFKDFVESLPARTAAKSGDKTVVSNSTDGPGSETTAAQAQKVLAGNVVQEFNPNRTSSDPYLAGEIVEYGGGTYRFKVNHYGAWNASNVETFVLNKFAENFICSKILNGGIGNRSNSDKVRTTGIEISQNTDFMVYINRPLSAGHYYQIGMILTDDSKAYRNEVYVGGPFNVLYSKAEVDAKIRVGQRIYFNSWPTAKVVAFEILERDENGTVVTLRDSDFYGYEIALIPVKSRNDSRDNVDNKCICYLETNTGVGGSATISYRFLMGGNVSSGVLFFSYTRYYNQRCSLNYISSDNIGFPFRVRTDGSKIVVDVAGTTYCEINVLDCSANVKSNSDYSYPSGWNEAGASTVSVNIKDIGNKVFADVPSGGVVSYLEGSAGGTMVFGYRYSKSNRMSTGLAMVTFTNSATATYKSINYIQFPDDSECPFAMKSDGTRTVVENTSSRNVSISFISCGGNWKHPKLGYAKPDGWDESSSSAVGSVNSILARYENETYDVSLDYSLINAIARINVDSNGSKDFCSLIVTDSHGDDSSISRAIKYAGISNAVSSVVHCGDVSDKIAYGTATMAWAGFVANSLKHTLFVQGNHEKGTYANIAYTPSDATLYNLFVKPIVDKGYLAVGEYEENKCYYYHDFTSKKIRLIVIDEFRAPLDYLETYWKAIPYDSSLQDIANNTSYVIGDKVNVPNFTTNSFQAVQDVNTGTYYSGKHPAYKCKRGGRYIDQTEAEWFLNTLYSTPSDYVVVIAMHMPFSDVATPQTDKKFCQTYMIPDGTTGATWNLNYMATDFVADALNAFKTGESYSATISTKSNTEAAYISDYSVAKDFSARGAGKLGLIIGGHVHRDVVWKHPTYTYMYQVTPMCSNTTSRDNNRTADIRLQDDSQFVEYIDSLTSFAVADERVALAKLGCKFTLDANVRDVEVL